MNTDALAVLIWVYRCSLMKRTVCTATVCQKPQPAALQRGNHWDVSIHAGEFVRIYGERVKQTGTRFLGLKFG